MSAEELIAIAQRHYPPGDSSRKGDRLLRVYGKRLEGVRRQPIALLGLGGDFASVVYCNWRARGQPDRATIG